MKATNNLRDSYPDFNFYPNNLSKIKDDVFVDGDVPEENDFLWESDANQKYNLAIDEAKEIFYKCLNTDESNKIKSLSRISGSIQVDDKIRKKLLFIKEREQIRFKLEIFRNENLRLIEDTVIKCINFEPVPDDIIDNTILSIQEVIDDLIGKTDEFSLISGEKFNSDPGYVYYLLLKDLSKRGISDLYDLSKILYRKATKTDLEFDRDSLLKLCDVWLTVITEYIFFNNKFKFLCKENKNHHDRLFIASNLAFYRNNPIASDDNIKKYIIDQNSKSRTSFINNICYQAYVIELVRSKMRAKYNFLSAYYEDKINRYEEILKNLLNEYSYVSKSERYLIKMEKNFDPILVISSFKTIFNDLKSKYKYLIENNIKNFGQDSFTYIDLSRRLYMTLEIIYSAFIQLSNYSKNSTIAKKYDITDENDTFLIDGEKKTFSFFKARDFYRDKVIEIADELNIPR